MSIRNILNKLNSRDTRIIPKFPKINKKIKFASILVAFVFLAFFSHQIIASSITIDKSEAVEQFKDKQAATKDGNNQESWMSEAASSNGLVGVNAIFGPIPDDVVDGTSTTTWVPNGLIGLTNRGIATLYNPPISGVQYIASIKNNLLGKPAYAATGYQGLSPLIPIWRGFRNVTYTIFSLIFVLIGIMIMLRVKISQNAVISIQSAIPKLITSLILVTFSYAIVGLLIDLSYVIEGLGVSLILNAAGNNTDTVTQIIQSPDILARISGLVPAGTIALFSGIISGIIAVVGLAIAGPAGLLIGLFAFILIWLIIGLMILWYTVKFFFGLAKCYVTIILKTIIAPLEIALGAIPNMKMGFSTWFTDVIANILVFPISVMFLVLINALMVATSGKQLWTPPGVDTLDALTSLSGGILPVAFGIGGLMLISKLPKMIPEFIFQIKPSPWGKAIGEGFAPIGGTIGKAAKGGAREGLASGSAQTFGKWGASATPGGRKWTNASKGINDMIQRFTQK